MARSNGYIQQVFQISERSDQYSRRYGILNFNPFGIALCSIVSTRVIQKVLLYTTYYVISNAYPYLVYSNLYRKVSRTKAQLNQSRDLS